MVAIWHDYENPAIEKHNHIESVSLSYEKITWKYNNGNTMFTDSWND